MKKSWKTRSGASSEPRRPSRLEARAVMRQVVMLSATGTSRLRRPSASVTASGSQSIVSGKYWRRRGGSCCAVGSAARRSDLIVRRFDHPGGHAWVWAAGMQASSTTMPPSIIGPANWRTSPMPHRAARLASQRRHGQQADQQEEGQRQGGQGGQRAALVEEAAHAHPDREGHQQEGDASPPARPGRWETSPCPRRRTPDRPRPR